MKRFLKIFILLLVSLFVLVSGLDQALNNLSKSNAESSYVWYSDKGEAVFAYNGDLTGLHKTAVAPPTFLHRG